MSTITSPEIIEKMLRNKGVYEDDPPTVIIYEYGHSEEKNKRHFAVFWSYRFDDMDQSPFVEWWTLLFAEGDITSEGEEWLLRRERTNGIRDKEKAPQLRTTN